MRALVLLGVTACGRLAFDPLAPAGDGGAHDGPVADGVAVVDARPDAPADATLAGLVAWYPLDEAVPGTFRDALGGPSGTCVTSCPTPTSGPHGGAYLFNGTDQCIAIPDAPAQHQQQLTIAAWFRADAIGFASLYAKRADVGNMADNSWQIELDPGAVFKLTTNNDNTNNDQITSAAIATVGAWHHLVGVVSGGSQTLYLDGAVIASGSYAVPLFYDTHASYIGCDDNGQQQGLVFWFTGALEDVQLYDRALSAAEVAVL